MPKRYKNVKTAGIYKLQNTFNNRFYIGSATNLLLRAKQHFWHLEKNNHQNMFLQNDYNKCGRECFEFKVLEYVQFKSRLVDIEQKYLDQYFDNTKTCYNICSVAYSRLGTVHSIETKKKMSKAWSDTRKEKLIKQSKKLGLYSMHGEKNPFFGKKHSKKTKTKISKANKGNKPSKNQINKMKLTFLQKYGGSPNKGKRKTAIEKRKDMLAQKTRKEIIAINMITGKTTQFNSIREASVCLNLVARHQISLILKSPYRKNGNYRQYKNWRFEHVKHKQ